MRGCSCMDQSATIENTDITRPEATCIFYQAAHHELVSLQQIIERVGIRRGKSIVGFVCVFDLMNVFRRRKNPLSVKNGGNLLDSQCVGFNGERGMDGLYAGDASQLGVRRKLVECRNLADKLADLRNAAHHAVGEGKQWCVSH